MAVWYFIGSFHFLLMSTHISIGIGIFHSPDTDCDCTKTAIPIPDGVEGNPVQIKTWSTCVSDGPREVCYGGKWRRKMRCVYEITGNVSLSEVGDKLTTLNSRARECYESASCQISTSGLYCMGSWTQWETNGACDCPTRTRIKSRYCEETSRETGLKVLSIQCAGSKGEKEQNQTVHCGYDGTCKDKLPRTKGYASTYAKRITTDLVTERVFTEPENTTSFRAETVFEPRSTYTDKITDTDETPEPVTTQTIIVGAAAGTVALAALILLIVVMQMKRKQNKKVENNNNTQATPPPYSTPSTLTRGPVSNRIYVPSGGNDGDYQMAYRPHPPIPNHKRPATTRPPHPQRPPLPAPMRDRSVTVDAVLGTNRQFDQQNNGYCGLGDFPTAPGGQYSGTYEVPMVEVADNELYCSIDDNGMARSIV